MNQSASPTIMINLSEVMAETWTVEDCLPDGLIGPGESPTPRAIFVFAGVCDFCIALIGSLGSGVAVWCVCGCPKTQPAVKVLLLTVFLPVLIICGVTLPLLGWLVMTIVFCDPSMRPFPLGEMVFFSISFLQQIEMTAIAALAVVRTVAVWSPNRYRLEVKVAVTMVVCIIVFCILTTFVIWAPAVLDYIKGEAVKRAINTMYSLINTMVPCLTTAASYVAMIKAVRRNHNRLVASQPEGGSTGRGSVVDQAMRAMLAVFISNLLLSVPHGIFHLLLPDSWQTETVKIYVHVAFYSHFMVDPLVFICFNTNYRERVSQKVKNLWFLCISYRKSTTRSQSLNVLSSTTADTSTKDSTYSTTEA